MNDLDFAAVHEELRDVARDLLGAGPPDVRQLADAGWLGLELPEELGGAGATFAEVAVVLEEMGRAATPGPYLGTAVLGAGALALLAPNPDAEALGRLVATGERTLAVALPTGDDREPPFRLERTGGGLRVHGRATFVPDAPTADRLLLVARGDDGEPVVVVVHDDHPGLEVAAQPVLDATRDLGTVAAPGLEVGERQVWRFAGPGDDAVRRLADRGAAAVACDSLGLAAAMLDATVAYAGARHQFGRPIGSFQAVKHACADMLVAVSVARELVAQAVAGVVAGDEAGSRAVARAKAHVSSAAVDVVGTALQLHGGIGYTWESGLHVHFKRATLDRSLFGSPRAHRQRLAGSLPGC
ncbi:MAG TPA: acyl-CoA dehydrogenase family protein [Acidimicrobiales bacterium]